jgi:hypothetical protein
MSDVSITYRGAEIASLDDSGTKRLLTSGKYCEDDIEVAYTKPSGGGGIELLASGTYTMTTTSADMYIPVSYTGTPTYAFVVNYNPTAGITQALSWSVPVLTQDQLNTVSGYFAGNDIAIGKRYYANGGTNLATVFTPTKMLETPFCSRQ